MGNHKYIESPEKMLELFNSYKEWVKDNPLKKHVFVGKDGVSDWELRERPITMDGFEVYCFKNKIINDLSDYFGNKDNRYSEYTDICRAIKKEIRSDQIDGGMANIYNPSITQRLNGLTEKTENKTEHSGSLNTTVTVIKSDAPIATSEKDIKLD